MISALLRHKLSFKQKNMEDILTSNVFDLFRYHAQPKSGLFRFLAKAMTLDGRYPLTDLLREDDPESGAVQYNLWPWWKNCQPDVVLDISGSSRFLVGIEAKYSSGKSSLAIKEEVEDDTLDDFDRDAQDDLSGETEDELNEVENDHCPADQLAIEWTDLVFEASKRHAKPVLVFLTGHLRCPRAEMVDSINDCNTALSPPIICWLSWRELPGLFRDNSDPHLFDLAALADEMELTFFEGISEVAPIRADWTFRGSTWRFDVAPITCDWRFKQ